MSLLQHELVHLTLSILSGLIVWKIYGKNWLVMPAALTGGVLLDVDHLFDYYHAYGLSFNLEKFLSGYQFLLTEKVYILFHGYEYVIILLVIYYFLKNKLYKALILAFTLGMLSHLIFDSIDNNMYVKSYTISSRIQNNFELKELVTPEHYKSHIIKKKLLYKFIK